MTLYNIIYSTHCFPFSTLDGLGLNLGTSEAFLITIIILVIIIINLVVAIIIFCYIAERFGRNYERNVYSVESNNEEKAEREALKEKKSYQPLETT